VDRSTISAYRLLIVCEAYEVDQRQLTEDAHLIWTLRGRARDHLVAHLCRSHDWPADLAIRYITALQRVRLGLESYTAE